MNHVVVGPVIEGHAEVDHGKPPGCLRALPRRTPFSTAGIKSGNGPPNDLITTETAPRLSGSSFSHASPYWPCLRLFFVLPLRRGGLRTVSLYAPSGMDVPSMPYFRFSFSNATSHAAAPCAEDHLMRLDVPNELEEGSPRRVCGAPGSPFPSALDLGSRGTIGAAGAAGAWD